MRVIVMAGGRSQRWQATAKLHRPGSDPLPVELQIDNKLELPIRGERLLDRSLRLLREQFDGPVTVYARDYPLPSGIERFWPEPHPDNLPDALAATAPLWTGPVRVLLGDVIWSRTGLAQMLKPLDQPWTCFGKLGGNPHTGKPGSEIYALGFEPQTGPELLAAIGQLPALLPDRRIWLWDLYRLLMGVQPTPQFTVEQRQHPPAGPHFREIADFTDDVDNLHQYLAINRYLARHPGEI